MRLNSSRRSARWRNGTSPRNTNQFARPQRSLVFAITVLEQQYLAGAVDAKTDRPLTQTAKHQQGVADNQHERAGRPRLRRYGS